MSLHEAMLYEKLGHQKAKCHLCARHCLISEGATGFCLVRKNEEGKLFSLNYGRAISACIDPVEKKPLSHFNPGALVLSIATVGCNFRCRFCDNWMISQEKEVSGRVFPPKNVVIATRDNGCAGISYTYPNNGELFVSLSNNIRLSFNTYMVKSSVKEAFDITPNVSGTLNWYYDSKTVLEFIPYGSFKSNTKYTVTIGTEAHDIFGTHMKEPYVFSFITRPD